LETNPYQGPWWWGFLLVDWFTLQDSPGAWGLDPLRVRLVLFFVPTFILKNKFWIKGAAFSQQLDKSCFSVVQFWKHHRRCFCHLCDQPLDTGLNFGDFLIRNSMIFKVQIWNFGKILIFKFQMFEIWYFKI
jgi:hypothetical protein